VNDSTSFESRFVKNEFLLATFTPKLNYISVVFVKGRYCQNRESWSVTSQEHAVDLDPCQVIRKSSSISPNLETAAIVVSFIRPNLNKIFFINSTNGTHLTVSLKGAECPISKPTDREAMRFAIKGCRFSHCGSLLFGFNDNGSIFCCLTLGSLIPLKFLDDRSGNCSEFLTVEPIKLQHEDLMKSPKVIHSLYSCPTDSILSFSNGYIIHIIKYPRLNYSSPGFSNPFLAQLIASGEELMNEIRREKTNENDRRILYRTFSQESIENSQKKNNSKNRISRTFASIRAKLSGKSKFEKNFKTLKLAASNLHLEKFQV
jgi:hypothetical protein